jgi:serine/threonine-protein kinase
VGLIRWLRDKLAPSAERAPLARDAPGEPALSGAREADRLEIAPLQGPEATPSLAQALREALLAGRFDDARASLREAAGGEQEADTLEAALAALGSGAGAAAQREGEPLDRFRVALAEALLARGGRARAAEVLSPATTPAAWVLRADLLAEGVDGAPTAHDLDRALALLARALRVDLDTPGARDRWERLRARVGAGPAVKAPDLGATVLQAGGTLPYVLRREVARGGAGVVYEAVERLGAIERTVALKMPHAGGSARDPLGHEARMAVRFRGPAVVPILDCDPEAGWLATPWMAGMSLRERLRASAAGGASDVDPRWASVAQAPLTWLEPVLEALAAVHAQGFAHGDVKPANVLFDDDGGAWLSDFGLARPFGAPGTPGSAGYVPPERIAGAEVSARDDVFGVGRIVEEILEAGWGQADRARLAALAARANADAAARPEDARALLAMLRG